MAAAFGSGVPLVIDSSAWHRQREPVVHKRWNATNDADLLVSCPVAALEILAGARDEREFELLDQAFGAFLQAPVTASVCRAPHGAMRELGARRRLPAVYYLIAAAAAELCFRGLHAHSPFELLARRPPVESGDR